MENYAYVLLGAGLSAAGILSFFKRNGKRKRCTASTVASVIQVDCEKDLHDAEVAKANRYDYSPIYSYTVNGKSYTWKGTYAKSKHAFHVGDRAQLWYNPQNPSEAFVQAADRGNRNFGIVLIAVGVLLIVFALKADKP